MWRACPIDPVRACLSAAATCGSAHESIGAVAGGGIGVAAAPCASCETTLRTRHESIGACASGIHAVGARCGAGAIRALGSVIHAASNIGLYAVSRDWIHRVVGAKRCASVATLPAVHCMACHSADGIVIVGATSGADATCTFARIVLPARDVRLCAVPRERPSRCPLIALRSSSSAFRAGHILVPCRALSGCAVASARRGAGAAVGAVSSSTTCDALAGRRASAKHACVTGRRAGAVFPATRVLAGPPKARLETGLVSARN